MKTIIKFMVALLINLLFIQLGNSQKIYTIPSNQEGVEFAENEFYFSYVYGNNDPDGEDNAILVMKISNRFKANDNPRTGSWMWRFSPRNKQFAKNLEITVTAQNDKSMDFVPSWHKQKCNSIIVDQKANISIDDHKAVRNIFMGLESNRMRMADGEVIASVNGHYQEVIYLQLSNFPHLLKITVEGGYFSDRNSPGEVASQLKAQKRLTDDFLKTLRFKIYVKQNAVASSNSDNTNTDENDDSTMTIIIGALAAIIAGGIVRKRKKGKKKTAKKTPEKSKKKKKKEAEEFEYVLQINKEKFTLLPGETQEINAKVWKIGKKSKKIVNAHFQVTHTEKAFKISPAKATGTYSGKMQLTGTPTQPEFYINLSASAEGHNAHKRIKISTGEKKIVVKTEPDNTRKMRPNIKQTITVYAKVIDEKGEDLDDLSKLIKFDGTHSDWIDLSNPVWQDGWIAINMQTSDPDANAMVSHPPATVTLGISVTYQEKNKTYKLDNNLDIELLDCKLETNLEQVTFPVSNEQSKITFDAYIEDCNDIKSWKFEANYMKDFETIDNAPLTFIDIEPVTENKVKISLTGPIIKPEEDEQFIRKLLVVKAQQKEEKPLERHIYVMVSKEGLFIEDGVNEHHEISFVADGEFEKEIVFGLYEYNEQTDQIVVNENGLKNLQMELINTDKISKNLNSVFKPQLLFDTLVTTIPHGRYLLSSAEEIPGIGEVHTLQYRIISPLSSENAKQFETTLTLQLKTIDDGKKHPSWDEAYNDCKYIINTYVPEGEPRIKLNALLEKRKVFLDAEGLVGLRQQIWKIARNLILAEGAEGYKNVEVWANRIVVTLEWTQWAGDIAFNALVSFYMAQYGAAGSVGSVAISSAKEEIIEGINFYMYEDLPAEVFIDRQYQKIVPMLMSVTKGHILSIENVERFVTKNKALAWAIFVTCEFTYNLYQTRSMIEAAKETARQLRDELIIRKVTHKLHKNAMRYKTPNTSVDEVLNDIKKSITGPKGHEEVNMKKVLEYMRDPAKVRTLKEHAPDWMKKAFDRTRTKIYDKHDNMLKKHLAEKYHLNPDDIKIDDFRTPGSNENNLNTDRDYRVLRKVKTNSGKEIWIEVQRSRWLDYSYEAFGDLTNKPSTITAKEWAEYHQQRGTDRFDAEASLDYSDHFFDPETDEVIKTDINIEKVKRGETTLYDAEALGKMYENKVMNSLEPGVVPEAYAQAKKGVKTLKSVREGYKKLGKKIPELNENLQKAMELVKKVPTDANINANKLAKVKADLNKLGYKDIGDVAKDMTNSFKDLAVHNQRISLKPIYKIK